MSSAFEIEGKGSFIFYSNLGFNVESVEKIFEVARKVIGKRIKLVISKSWVLTSLCYLEFSKKGIEIMGPENLPKITKWDEIIFMNFHYQELRNFIPKIKFILLNFIDSTNIEFCKISDWVHEWKLFTSVKFMAYSEIAKQLQYQRKEDRYVKRLNNPFFRYFLPLNVYVDRNKTFRYKSLEVFFIDMKNNAKTEKYNTNLYSGCSSNNNTTSNDNLYEFVNNFNNNNIILQYPYENISALESINVKQSMQKLLYSNHFWILNLSTTYLISKHLHKLLREELYAQFYFVNSKTYLSPIENNKNLITNLNHTKRTSSGESFEREFFYFKDSTYSIFNKHMKYAIDFNFFAYYTVLLDMLHKQKKYTFVTALFEYTFHERIGGNLFAVTSDFALDFDKLHSNINIIL